jgi:hypothetical protein
MAMSSKPEFATTYAEAEYLRAENERLQAYKRWADGEIERLRAAIEAFLENDSQANWDTLAALVGRDVC